MFCRSRCVSMAFTLRSVTQSLAKVSFTVSNLTRPSPMVNSNSVLLLNVRGHKRWLNPIKREFKRRKDKMGPEKPTHRNTYVEWNYNAELYAFGQRLGEDFDADLLRQALTQRSYIIQEEERQKSVGIEEPQLSLQDNSGLAKIGESLLKSYVKRYLRTVYPRFPEEGICSICEYLLCDEVLADIASNIGMAEIILTSDFPVEATTLANVFKAIIYAIKESSGEDRANVFIRDFLITYLSGKDINELWIISDPEAVLANILEKEGKGPAESRLIGQAGPNTILAAHQIGLYCNKELIGFGCGESVSVAKEMAAKDTLKRLFGTTDRARPIPFNLELSGNSKEPFANLSIEDWCEKNIKTLLSKSI